MEITEQFILNKMKVLDLTPIEEVSSFLAKKKRFYAAPVLNSLNKKVFFKFLIVDDPVPKETIKKEIEMRNLMLNFQDEITFPHLIKYNNQTLPFWFISEYLEGDIFGFLYELFVSEKSIVSLLVNTLVALHKITEKNLTSILKNHFFLKRDSFNQPVVILTSFEEKIDSDLKPRINFQKIHHFVKLREKYFQNHKTILAHGDYTLNNMVLRNKQMILTDWESACLSNIASDIAHLWIQLWRYPELRQNLVFDYVKTLPENEINEFKRLFEAKVIFEALAELIWNIKICPPKYHKALIEICIKTTDTALEGFDSLLKI